MKESIGSFQVLGTLGKGAHSSILHIRRARDGKQYALKVVPIADQDEIKFLTQAQHEFRVGQMLNHDNILRIHRLELEREWWILRVRKVHLLLDYVKGKTLDQVPRLSIPRLVQIFERISSALMHMHRRGVCHADLKPNNVMLSHTGGIVKVIDFGLAWIKNEPKDRVQGTPEYIAPEQVREQTVTEQTDIYNFGATMYRLVTWRLPPSTMKEGMNAKVFEHSLRPVAELNPQTPKPLCDLIHRCLSYHPDHRPQRAIDIHDELEALVPKVVRKSEDQLEVFEW